MMSRKKILVDLSALDDVYQGMGQIALNYGHYFKETYRRKTSPYDLTLLLPKAYFGKFGDEPKYLSSSNWLRRHCRYLFPKFDLWHNIHHTSRFKPYSAGATKYIYTIHDFNCLMLEYEGTQQKVNSSYRRMNRHIRKSDLIIAISEFVCQQIGQFLSVRNTPIRMIYNGVEKIADIPPVKPRNEIKQPFFLSISAFREKKNFHLLLDMMQLMPQKQLYLAGNDNTEYGRRIKERIANEKITNVHLLGKVSEAEKVWLYAHCEAFLFPSTFEGFGLPVIEAMQFGKPVFSSKETSLKEIGGSCTYFWDSLNPKAMKNVIEENIDNFYQTPELADMEKRYADTFSYKTYFEKYEEIYATM